MNDTFKSFAAGVLFTLIIMLTVLTGASCTENQPSQATGEIGDCNDMVLARVGDRNLTLGDLLEIPNVYGLVHEQVIVRELLEQEALSRGIITDMDDIEAQVDAYIEQSGGWENFLSNVPPSIPASLVPADLRKSILQNSRYMAIIEDRFDKEHGPATNDEMETLWLAQPGMYKSRASARLNIEPEEATMENAREELEDDIREQWQNERLPHLIEYLKESTKVEFYLFDALNEPTYLQIPEIDDDDSLEYVPLDEHEDEPSDEGHEDHGEESEVGENSEAEDAEVPDEPEEDEGT